MARVRVVQRADGQVSVMRPADPGLSVQEFERVCARDIERSAETLLSLVGLPYVDLDTADLPPRELPCPDCQDLHSVRDQWSLVGGAVVVDDAAPNPHRELAHVRQRLSALVDVADPDPVEYTRLQQDVARLAGVTGGKSRAEMAAAIDATRKRGRHAAGRG